MLAEDVRECPATWTLAASWTLVFALMHLVQWQDGVAMPPGGLANPLGISPLIGHRFGDLTWAEVRHGEAWRLVTATFIHFSLIHVGMNVFGLIKLGQLVEPWYGSGPFLAVCLAIGGLGNLAGGLMRQAITSAKLGLAGTRVAQAWPGWFDVGGADGAYTSFRIPSGGGSTILLGLLGLAAVVGWRSKTRIGSFLRDQMITILGFTAFLGVALYNLIDNYGHAGGAVVGAAFGFVHRPLFRLAERSRPFRRSCWVGVAAACVAVVAAAARDDHAEAGFRADLAQALARLNGDARALDLLDRASILYARNLSLTFDAHDPMGQLDLIAIEPLLKMIATAPIPGTAESVHLDQWRARTRVELAAVVEALGPRPADPWDAAVAGEIAEVRDLARAAAAAQPPGYSQVYAFTVAWRAATAAIGRDRDRANLRLVQIDRQAR